VVLGGGVGSVVVGVIELGVVSAFVGAASRDGAVGRGRELGEDVGEVGVEVSFECCDVLFGLCDGVDGHAFGVGGSDGGLWVAEAGDAAEREFEGFGRLWVVVGGRMVRRAGGGGCGRRGVGEVGVIGRREARRHIGSLVFRVVAERCRQSRKNHRNRRRGRPRGGDGAG